MVDLDSKLNSFLVNRERRLDLPTPESPINTTATQNINYIAVVVHTTFENFQTNQKT